MFLRTVFENNISEKKKKDLNVFSLFFLFFLLLRIEISFQKHEPNEVLLITGF